MIERLSFCQYIHKESVIHCLDPRLKIVYVIILSMTVFLINNVSKILTFSFFVLIILLLTKINIAHFIRSLRPFFFIFAFILSMYAIFSLSQINQGFIAIWRFLMLIPISLILTFTTTTSCLIAAIERLIQPIKIFNVNPRNVATMISIAVRFMPVMFVHFERQSESMVARLANFRKIKNINLIIMNLLQKMIKSAYLLSDAMQSRLYNENAKSHKTLRLDRNDYISAAFVLIFLIAIY